MRLAAGVGKWVEKQYNTRLGGDDTLIVCIETPVLKSTNVSNYRKQASTIALIEEVMMLSLCSFLVEVNPTEVKMAATGHGNADKTEILHASPFKLKLQDATAEALADAWAVALAGKEHEERATHPKMWGFYPTHAEVIL